MTNRNDDFTAYHYTPRATDYVLSSVHSEGADLDEVEQSIKGKGYRRVLDLGCGGGHVSYRIAPYVDQVVACDITASMLNAVASQAIERKLPNIMVKQASAEKLPFDSAFFDAIVCRFSAHHWGNMEAGLREARRVLHLEGIALFIDSVAPSYPLYNTYLQAIELLRDVSHVRNYTLPEWIAALSRAGFSVQKLTPRRLRMVFQDWVNRTHCLPEHQLAIRSLQLTAAEDVQRYFALEKEGSFLLDTLTISATAA
ncbi:MAG: class I SAM-dependent methyltransferase [Zymomonas mobilis subsp. pomaceae]|uniref:Methyltransferase type 11 n=1 Tax=Zymomonas mobilis subsp. pomaceae (strain ATCC 29192 / DSM 22645 / JCM 10191 / CCUG 17912 / NBRC 13757 / NCIMB 11200 / NRRL B-4491 / Barker I) TaxID=579138 RepID=F8EUA5_ZYMMT|nr:class I SAM-dependent methyltransferase [Zymomonas mobilis]AEI38126.1 Methyltransferase type 11 [Zymomonas mobilis subsp. pomaceae ATCC 29192]MDX5949493.1 class I SAM-dependent methyltransferase [Zymomonas mobilis subsp. pomaceae]GEB89236.1 S-adenosyl-L-methionine (SAM)-dependent methyltransferase PhcB [Zymomonas mobilis subsp. pomaceae]